MLERAWQAIALSELEQWIVQLNVGWDQRLQKLKNFLEHEDSE